MVWVQYILLPCFLMVWFNLLLPVCYRIIILKKNINLFVLGRLYTGGRYAVLFVDDDYSIRWLWKNGLLLARPCSLACLQKQWAIAWDVWFNHARVSKPVKSFHIPISQRWLLRPEAILNIFLHRVNKLKRLIWWKWPALTSKAFFERVLILAWHRGGHLLGDIHVLDVLILSEQINCVKHIPLFKVCLVNFKRHVVEPLSLFHHFLVIAPNFFLRCKKGLPGHERMVTVGELLIIQEFISIHCLF
jgi:hypothetical protein